jgi:hypothetical protein
LRTGRGGCGPGLLGIFWLVSARKWFTGPWTRGDEARLTAIERVFAHVQAELEEVD